MAKKEKHKHLNPVAKFAGQFNQSVTFQDRTKYNRKIKGANKLPFCWAMLLFLDFNV